MRKLKLINLIIPSVLVFCLTTLNSGAGKSKERISRGKDTPLKAGEHIGEIKQLDVNITLYGQYGETVTDENGTFYHVWGYTFYEDKVYPPEYWGVFPLYFFNTTVGVSIDVTNNGPRKKVNLRVRTEAYFLRTDGSNGAEMTPPNDTDILVEVGETKTVDASFIAADVPDAESGLDRLIVKILHPNKGGGPGNSDPALILMKEAIFCPPENEGEILTILDQILNP